MNDTPLELDDDFRTDLLRKKSTHDNFIRKRHWQYKWRSHDKDEMRPDRILAEFVQEGRIGGAEMRCRVDNPNFQIGNLAITKADRR
jgi:hypothetical protein